MRIRALVSSALALVALSTPSFAVTSGDNGTHDPSRMVESGGKYWVYSTGGGSKSSPDGLKWTNGPRIFPNGFPAWLKTLLPTDQGLWAPDLIYSNGLYYLYYSVAGLPKKACAIGLVTSPTLDPKAPGYGWTDRGLVVSNDEVVKYATIDPAPVFDADGNLWVVWGGGYSNPNDADSIWVTRLDNQTGLPSASDPMKPGHPILKGHKEGPYIHYRSGYYYVFWQTGGCCSGTSSTYTIHMARSKAITGPYEGDKIFDSSHGDVHGPGHIGIYDACGASRFTYHYYPNNGSILGNNELVWGDDGWPVAGADATTPLEACGAMGEGGSGSGGGGSVGGGASGSGGAGTGGAGGTPMTAGVGGNDTGGGAGESTRAGSGGDTASSGGGAGSAGVSQMPSAGTASGGAVVTSGEPPQDAGCSMAGARRGNAFALLLALGAGWTALRRPRLNARRNA